MIAYIHFLIILSRRQ